MYSQTPQIVDSKKERFISIGKSRHRIANDHHELLSRLHTNFRYLSMEQLLFLTSFFGASVALLCGIPMLISVLNRAAHHLAALIAKGD